MVKVEKNYIILIYLYSFAAHIILISSIASLAAGKNASFQNALELSSNKRPPFSFKVSLTGRRGNTFDESKINADAEFDKIKKLFSEGARFVNRSLAPPDKPAAKNPDIKKTAAKGVEKAPVKKGLPIKKVAHPTPPLNAQRRAGGDESGAANAGAAGYGPSEGESKTEVFGNLSGSENSGSSLAGSPQGDIDPAIELKSIELFKAIVGDKIRANIKYPQSCRRLGIEGTVKVRFEISSSGSVNGVEIVSSSNNEDIDASAAEAVKKSVPFLPFPRDTSKSFITFVLPLNYRLND